MVSIYHTSAQSFRHVYFSIIADYLDILKSLLGVTRSLNQNVGADFGMNFNHLFFVVIFAHLIDLVGNNLHCFHAY